MPINLIHKFFTDLFFINIPILTIAMGVIISIPILTIAICVIRQLYLMVNHVIV